MTLQANKIIQKTFNSFILFASGRQECTLLFRFEFLFTLLNIIKSIHTDVVNILCIMMYVTYHNALEHRFYGDFRWYSVRGAGLQYWN